jgi:hypothetical protein
MWSHWQSELEALSVFAEEWNEDLAEKFIAAVKDIAARKRAQKQVSLNLKLAIQKLQEANRPLLAFFDLDQACSRWSTESCPLEDRERVLVILEDWNERLQGYAGKYPPSETRVASFAALQILLRDAQADVDAVRGGFGSLDAYLAPQIKAAPAVPVAVVEDPESPQQPPATPLVECQSTVDSQATAEVEADWRVAELRSP